MPLSNKQMEYLAIAWACMDTEPKIDYERFRELAGLKTAHSARELMRVTKNKLKDEYGPSGDVQAGKKTPATSTPKKTASAKKTPVSRKRTKAEVEDNVDDMVEQEASPSMVKKQRTASVEHDMSMPFKPEHDTTSELYGSAGYY